MADDLKEYRKLHEALARVGIPRPIEDIMSTIAHHMPELTQWRDSVRAAMSEIVEYSAIDDWERPDEAYPKDEDDGDAIDAAVERWDASPAGKSWAAARHTEEKSRIAAGDILESLDSAINAIWDDAVLRDAIAALKKAKAAFKKARDKLPQLRGPS